MKVICSVCRERFSPLSEISAVECGHLFHESCISKWCETNPSCPYCRFKIKNLPFRVEFDMRNYDDDKLSESNEDSLTQELLLLHEEEKELKLKYDELKEELLKLEKETIETEKKARRCNYCIKIWQKELNNAKNGYDTRERLKEENKAMKTEISTLTSLKKLIYGNANDMQEILVRTSVSSHTVEELSKYVQAMRYKLKKNQENYKKQKDKLISLTQEVEKEFLVLNEMKNKRKQVSDKSVQTENVIIRKVKKKRNVQPIIWNNK